MNPKSHTADLRGGEEGVLVVEVKLAEAHLKSAEHLTGMMATH